MLKILFRSFLGIAIGYFVIVGGTTLLFSLLPNSGAFTSSGYVELGVAGIMVFLCAACGGFLTAKISGRAPFIHAGLVGILIVAETMWIVTTGVGDAPVWFDILGGLNLLLGILFGTYLSSYHKFRALKS